MSIPAGVDVQAICGLAWELNVDIVEWFDIPFTEYCSTPLFAKLAMNETYGQLYEDSFGNLSVSDVPTVMAALDHHIRSDAPTRASLALIIIMVIVVALRVYSRLYLLVGGLKVEDYLIIFGAAISCIIHGFNAATTYQGGGGKHFYDLTERENYYMLKWSWFLTFFYNFAMLPIKLSFLWVYASFYARHSARFRWACYFVAFIVIVGNVVFILANFLWVCSPFDEWNYIAINWQICANSDVWNLAASYYNIGSDIVIFLLPLSIVIRMKNLGVKDRIALVSLFALGALVCVISAVRIIPTNQYEVLWDYTPYAPMMWGLYTIEPALAAIVACLPSMRVLVLALIGKPTSSENNASDSETTPIPVKQRHNKMLFRRNDVSVKELDINAVRTVDRLAGVRSIIARARRSMGIVDSSSTLKESVSTKVDGMSKDSTPLTTHASRDPLKSASMDHPEIDILERQITSTSLKSQDDVV